MKNRSIMKNKTPVTIFTALLLITPIFVFAQIINPLKAGSTFSQLFHTLFNYVVVLGGGLATGAFVYAGFLYVKAQGNEKELENAKNVFINTVYGTALLLGADIIANIITNTISSLK